MPLSPPRYPLSSVQGPDAVGHEEAVRKKHSRSCSPVAVQAEQVRSTVFLLQQGPGTWQMGKRAAERRSKLSMEARVLLEARMYHPPSTDLPTTSQPAYRYSSVCTTTVGFCITAFLQRETHLPFRAAPRPCMAGVFGLCCSWLARVQCDCVAVSANGSSKSVKDTVPAVRLVPVIDTQTTHK